MNIEKIKVYNQKMLALLSTLLVLLTLTGLLLLLISSVQRLNRNIIVESSEVILETPQPNEKEAKKPRQTISYGQPILVDSSKMLYIIPANNKYTAITEDIFSSKSRPIEPNVYYDDNFTPKIYYQTFSNLIIYNAVTHSSQKMFKQSLYAKNLSIHHTSNDPFIVFYGATTDSNDDQKISSEDLYSIFLFSTGSIKVRTIIPGQASALSYTIVPGSKDLLIGFGQDLNKDGSYQQLNEPVYIYRYYYERDSLVKVVEE